MRKQPTEEQKRKAAERRERFRALAKQIAAIPEDERAAIAMRAGIHTIEGRPLSFVNQCLLVSQRAGVSVVGGFQQWKKAGRQVRKGEHGLSIWVPTFGKSEASASEAGESESESGARRGFIMGTVFDISQTEPAEVTTGPDYRVSGCVPTTGVNSFPH